MDKVSVAIFDGTLPVSDQPIFNHLKLPDIWQQDAVRYLQEGKDVVVHAPTGAGKTYIFELLVKAGLKRQAVYTVPTRALANDKLQEWREQGWNVGIATGDLAEKLDAPVIVATLETQKNKLVRGEGPGLLVIDEYQMLADETRGTNYELAIALAPPNTQILMLSGSVANPGKVVDWLKRIGRDAVLVNRRERPVPQEEIQLDGLPNRVPNQIRGFWPRLVTRALIADLGPILIFAPQRKAAEAIARQLSAALPTPDWLELTAEQKALAGDPLNKMLRNRIAFHHSGLSYPQRAGLIEPLAKAGQLRIVVATTGLAAGINFSMRSVLVTDREYHAGGKAQLIRSDELLQMFGRAGRRGLDNKGYVLVAPDKPRLVEARPLSLKRSSKIDWPSFLAVMDQAAISGESPIEAAEDVSQRLFSDTPMRLGLKRFTVPKNKRGRSPEAPATPKAKPKLTEMFNSQGHWERQKAPVKALLGNTLIYHQGGWKNALEIPETLKEVKLGTLCRIKVPKRRYYGRQITLAHFPKKENKAEVVLSKWIHKQLCHYYEQAMPDNRTPGKHWELDRLERKLVPLLPFLTQGGKAHEIIEHQGVISARLDYSEATVFARIDSLGCPLINPPYREIEPPVFPSFAEMAQLDTLQESKTIADIWYQLGLINDNKSPTRRGVITSFFNHGEGLAIAAALEDKSYPLEDLIYDIANLRAGHRFEEFDNTSSRLGDVCRLTYRSINCHGYLELGVPLEYGNGAAEVLQAIKGNTQQKAQFCSETLHSGDIERADLEWRSILNHICFAPDYDWDRWTEFKDLARVYIATHFAVSKQAYLPELTSAQRQRYKARFRI